MASAHTATSSIEVTTRSRLLELPGELRNRIYDYVAQNTFVALMPRSYLSEDIPTRANTGQYVYSPEHVNDRIRLSREDLGLTQACRQLRKEYLPIHYENLDAVIHWSFVEEYVDTFFPGDSIAYGNLWIDTGFELYHQYYSSTRLSLLPLARLSARSPTFIIRCRSIKALKQSPADYYETFETPWTFYDVPLDALIERLVGDQYGGKCKRYLLTSVTKLEVIEYKPKVFGHHTEHDAWGCNTMHDCKTSQESDSDVEYYTRAVGASVPVQDTCCRHALMHFDITIRAEEERSWMRGQVFWNSSADLSSWLHETGLDKIDVARDSIYVHIDEATRSNDVQVSGDEQHTKNEKILSDEEVSVKGETSSGSETEQPLPKKRKITGDKEG